MISTQPSPASPLEAQNPNLTTMPELRTPGRTLLEVGMTLLMAPLVLLLLIPLLLILGLVVLLIVGALTTEALVNPPLKRRQTMTPPMR